MESVSNSGMPFQPQSSSATAPGLQQYDMSQGNGMHMPPPPVPPLNIPQNNNPIPTALSDNGGTMSAGGTVRRAAPEPNKRALYVGGLDQRVTEEVLKQIFETTGHVQSVKIIPDKNVSRQSTGSSSDMLRSVFVLMCCGACPFTCSLGSKLSAAIRHSKTCHAQAQKPFPILHPLFHHLKRMYRIHPDYFPQLQAKGFNYGFVEYDDPAAAERAMATLNGRRVHQSVSSVSSDPFHLY